MDTYVVLSSGTVSTSGVIAIVVGVLVVIMLIAAFVWGSRRREKEPPPAPVDPTVSDPAEQPGGPDADSWTTPPATPGEGPRGR